MRMRIRYNSVISTQIPCYATISIQIGIEKEKIDFPSCLGSERSLCEVRKGRRGKIRIDYAISGLQSSGRNPFNEQGMLIWQC